MRKYIIDIKNLQRPEQLKEKLKRRWKVTELSDRTFEVEGREFTIADVRDMWPNVGKDGHVFSYDTELGTEYYRPNQPKGRKRNVARDEDLDPKTVEVVGDYNMELGEDF